jgi:hypothetical protein
MKLFTPKDIVECDIPNYKQFFEGEYDSDDVPALFFRACGAFKKVKCYVIRSKRFEMNGIIGILQRWRNENEQNIHIALNDPTQVKEAFIFCHSVSVWTKENNKIYAEVYLRPNISTFKRSIMPEDENNISHILSAFTEIFSIYSEVENSLEDYYSIRESKRSNYMQLDSINDKS